MQLTTQVLARNTRKQVVVLSSDPKGTETVEWQAAGDPNGGDLQIIPETIANTVQFVRLMQRGIIVKEESLDAESVARSLDLQRAAFDDRTATQAQKGISALDPAAKNDIMQVSCQGPDARGNMGQCGVPVTEREAAKGEKPALCSQHDSLASRFVRSERPKVEGKPEVEVFWTMAMLAPRETQQQ